MLKSIIYIYKVLLQHDSKIEKSGDGPIRQYDTCRDSATINLGAKTAPYSFKTIENTEKITC